MGCLTVAVGDWSRSREMILLGGEVRGGGRGHHDLETIVRRVAVWKARAPTQEEQQADSFKQTAAQLDPKWAKINTNSNS